MFEWMEILEWLQAPRTRVGRALRMIGCGLWMLLLVPVRTVYERVSRRRERRMAELHEAGQEAGH